MDNLKKGDILIRLSDGSRWQFVHYPSAKRKDKYTTLDSFQGDRQLEDKNFVHASEWNKENNDWDESNHEDIPISEFKKLEL